jgi:hypothetical protein
MGGGGGVAGTKSEEPMHEERAGDTRIHFP